MHSVTDFVWKISYQVGIYSYMRILVRYEHWKKTKNGENQSWNCQQRAKLSLAFWKVVTHAMDLVPSHSQNRTMISELSRTSLAWHGTPVFHSYWSVCSFPSYNNAHYSSLEQTCFRVQHLHNLGPIQGRWWTLSSLHHVARGYQHCRKLLVLLMVCEKW